MTQDPNAAASSPTPEPVVPTLRKKPRRWPWVILILLVGLILLVLLGPTLASVPPIKSIVIGRVNAMLNGHVEVGSYSVGWFSPIKASGIKVYDEQSRLIADVPNVKINLTLLEALRQKFHLEKGSQIDVASFVLNVDQNNQTNFQKLLKSEPKAAAKEQTNATTQAVASKQSPLPDISGEITVNFAGTVEGAGVAKPIQVEPSSAVVTITDINQPITNAVTLKYRVGDSAVSTLQTNGTIDAIKNNLLNVGDLAAGQKISFGDVNLAALEPFIKLGAATTQPLSLAGSVTGDFDVKAAGAFPTAAAGTIHVKGLKVGGGPLGQDQFATDTIDFPVNVVSENSGGQTLYKFTDVGLTMAQAKVSVTGQVPQQVLLNLKDNKAPGGDGTLAINAVVTDLPNLAGQLRNTLQLQKDVSINSGSITQGLTMTFSQDRITVAESFYAAASGTRGGQPVQIQPITINVSAAALPNGSAIPDVRDLKLAIASAFANATGGGASLAKLGISGSFDLAKLSAEARQFADLSGKTVAGSGTFTLNSSGDLTNPSSPLTAVTNATLTNVQIVGVMAQPVNFDRLTLSGSGEITRQANDFQRVDKGYFSLASGDPAKPAFYAQGDGNYDLKAGNATWFEVKASAPSLAVLQQQYGGFVNALSDNKIAIQSGALALDVAGSYVNQSLVFARPITANIDGITVIQDKTTVLNNEQIQTTVDFNINGNDATVKTFTLTLPRTNALNIKATAAVKDLSGSPTISGVNAPDAQLDLGYDAAALWPMVQPFLSPEMREQYKGLKITGKYSKTFKVSGQYSSDAKLTGPQKLAKLKASGDLALDLLDLPQGLTIKAFDLPFTLEKGVLRTQAAPTSDTRKFTSGKDRPAATALCNDGALNLDGLAIELNYADPLLSIERKHMLLDDVALSSVLADSMGQNIILFKDAKQASGLLDVQIMECKRVPLGDLISKKQSAAAQVVFNMHDLRLDSGPAEGLSVVMGLGDQGISGNIQNGTISLASGKVDSAFSLDLAQAPGEKMPTTKAADNSKSLAFTGGVILATQKLENVNVNIPANLIDLNKLSQQYDFLGKAGLGKIDLAKTLPNGLNVPFTGTVTKYKFDVQGAVTKSFGVSVLKGGNINPDDALKNLGDLLGKKKKKKNDS